MSPFPDCRNRYDVGATAVNPALPGCGDTWYTPSWMFGKLNVPVASVVAEIGVKFGYGVVQMPADGGFVTEPPGAVKHRCSVTVMLGTAAPALVLIVPVARLLLYRKV